MSKRMHGLAVIFILLASGTPGRADAPKLDLCDVTWLWPVPQTEQDLDNVLSIDELKTAENTAIWSDEQFEDVLKTADGDFATVQDHRIRLPAEVRTKSAWRIVAFRADPTAPGGHELIRQNFGEKPQLRLVLQPVTVVNGKVTVHDIAIHAVYGFVVKADGQPEGPDRERFKEIVRDLDALKKFVSDASVTTDGRPLGVHPGLKAKTPKLRNQVQAFLEKHLHPRHLSAMAIMGLDGPEPWIFVALGKFPPNAERFGPIPFLPAQMLSFRTTGGVVLPVPKVNNRNPIPNKLPMPAEEKDRRGVATAALFTKVKPDLDAFAVVGKDAQGQPVLDAELRNRDIPDLIADPVRTHFFNADCLSCHTETRRRLQMTLNPGEFAYLRDGKPPAIEADCLPKHDWNVRNLGWFPPHAAIGGGPTVPTVTQRTANETAEVVAFIEAHYRRDFAADELPVDGQPKEDAQASESVFGQNVTYLDQGWSDDERQDFYFLGQGSQLVPYLWFLSLEFADRNESFRSDEHMRALGFIPQKSDRRRNPDGLPIGFVKDSNSTTIAVKRGFLGAKFDNEHYPRTSDWLGLTCAACHTSELRSKDKTIRIDGGAAMADVETFLADLAGSLRATLASEQKFRRFEQSYRKNAGGDVDTTQLRDELEAYTPVIETLVERNKAEHPYGLGRLDAFGAILNQICEAGLEIRENHRPSNAPVSYPFLWFTPQLDWVQWNSSVENPISRNVGEVLGVFAHARLTGAPQDGQFTSSARVDYLHRLEQQVQKLTAPTWPEEFFGKIDPKRAAAGRVLYEANCAGCHNSRDEAGEFHRTEPNEFGMTFIRTTSVPFDRIGTDPQMIVNFLTRLAKPGDLAPAIESFRHSPEAAAQLQQLESLFEKLGKPKPDFTREVPGGWLLKVAVSGVVNRHVNEESLNLTDEQRAAVLLKMYGYRAEDAPPLGGAGYKARPLAGVWATAPFGHAGAVPNLYQWLLPEAERVKNFRVGNLEFDEVDVGFSTKDQGIGFLFATEIDGRSIPGNSNRGHSGPRMTDFDDQQRRQIIEYLKTLR